MSWNFDMSQCPKSYEAKQTRQGKKGPYEVDVTIDVPVILAAKDGEVVTKSRWLLPNDGDRPKGRWEGFSANEVPLAWMLWPGHPNAGASS